MRQSQFPDVDQELEGRTLISLLDIVTFFKNSICIIFGKIKKRFAVKVSKVQVEGPPPLFTHAEIHMENPLVMEPRFSEPSKSSTPVMEPALKGSFPKPL